MDIIKHVREIDGKSTAVHAKIIAPDDVNIYTYPDFPEWSPTENVFVIFDFSKTFVSFCLIFFNLICIFTDRSYIS